MKRRELLQGTFAGAAALSLPFGLGQPAVAGQVAGQRLLSIVRRIIEVNGQAATVFGVQQPDGSAGIRYRANDAFNLLLRNETAEPTIIHWHGLTPPGSKTKSPCKPGEDSPPLPRITPEFKDILFTKDGESAVWTLNVAEGAAAPPRR